MIVIALDTSRDMRHAIRPVLAGVRKVMRRRPRDVRLCAIGDYRCHLLQIDVARPHICGLDKSYETAMYHYAHSAARGTLVFCGNGVPRDAVAGVHLGLDRNPYTRDVLRALRSKFSIRMLYVSRGVYDTDDFEWETLLGKQNVAVLDDPRRTAGAMLALMRHA